MIHKAFLIIEALASKKVNTIMEISQMTGLPKSTVHRILQMLAEEEVVTIKPHKGYVLTPKLISIGLNGIAEKALLDLSIPIMRRIADLTRETVSLNVICGHERVCVYRVEGDYPITTKISVGDKGPLFRGAVGKVIVSGLSQPELEGMLQKYIAMGVIPEENTAATLEKVRKTREQGYAVSVHERTENAAAIAVPIKDFAGHTLASLSISTLAERLTAENQENYLKLLLDAAKQISAAQVI